MAAIDYLERNLYGPADLEAAAKEANCSVFHFYRMFQVVAGIGPGEYLRRRRLSEAAMALSTGGSDKVIELALRFGYDSPDSFARAFRREFGCLPSDARKRGVSLHSYPRMTFTVVLRGDRPMEYRIEEGPAFTLAGISIRVKTKDGSNFLDVPAFWDEVMTDGRWKTLCAKADFKRLGVCGVSRDFDMVAGAFTYSVAVNRPSTMEGMPDQLTPALCRLVGVGAGLTPSGDDFLSGFMAASRTSGSPALVSSLARAITTNLAATGEISASLLRCAVSGMWPTPLADLADALTVDETPAALCALHDLCRLGHSSGADIATGFLFGLVCLLREFG